MGFLQVSTKEGSEQLDKTQLYLFKKHKTLSITDVA